MEVNELTSKLEKISTTTLSNLDILLKNKNYTCYKVTTSSNELKIIITENIIKNVLAYCKCTKDVEEYILIILTSHNKISSWKRHNRRIKKYKIKNTIFKRLRCICNVKEALHYIACKKKSLQSISSIHYHDDIYIENKTWIHEHGQRCKDILTTIYSYTSKDEICFCQKIFLEKIKQQEEKDIEKMKHIKQRKLHRKKR